MSRRAMRWVLVLGLVLGPVAGVALGSRVSPAWGAGIVGIVFVVVLAAAYRYLWTSPARFAQPGRVPAAPMPPADALRTLPRWVEACAACGGLPLRQAAGQVPIQPWTECERCGRLGQPLRVHRADYPDLLRWLASRAAREA